MATDKKNPIVDAITKMLAPYCTDPGAKAAEVAGKYIATMAIRSCNDTCWKCIAVGSEFTPPTYTRESIALTSSGAAVCGAPTNNQDDLTWLEYVPDTSVSVETTDLMLDMTASTLKMLDNYFRTGQKFMLNITLNDPDLTQLSFVGFLTTAPIIGVQAKTATDLTTVTATIQPSGPYYLSEGVSLQYCS